MKDQKQEQQHTSNSNEGQQRDDIRNSEMFKESGGQQGNNPAEDRIAKTEREGWVQQQGNGGNPIVS